MTRQAFGALTRECDNLTHTSPLKACSVSPRWSVALKHTGARPFRRDVGHSRNLQLLTPGSRLVEHRFQASLEG